MGHYASETHYRWNEEAKKIDTLLYLGFVSEYGTGKYWSCPVCGASVKDDLCEKHAKWHEGK